MRKKKPVNVNLLNGVIVPGETYFLLSESHSHLDAGPIEDLFTIRTTEDLLAAIEAMDLVIFERFEYRRLLEVRSRDHDRSTLRLKCYDKMRKLNRPIYLFLHRIPGVGEMIKQVKERSGDGITENETQPEGQEGQEVMG
ncbi:MAG TPA: hypothetical protein VFE32_21470 [Puia sp.]|jgi:hypothetical protein|nr:hypothetical protein [Puia sp.]